MLSDTVCIVTGGGRGIGEAVAVELGREGASVVVNDLGTEMDGSGRSEEPATTTARAVREAGGEAMAHVGDASSLSDAEDLVASTLEEYGRLDGVVNFAGIAMPDPVTEISGEEWDEVVRVHLRSHFALLKTAATVWLGADGAGDGRQRSFVGVTSRAALGFDSMLHYATAKAGVLGFTRTAARELYPQVRVNALMPTAYSRMQSANTEKRRQEIREQMPPEKVAPVVTYLLGGAAEDVTGCTFRAAGDVIGLVSDPEIQRLGYREGGWSAEEIADPYVATIEDEENLTRSDVPF